RGGGGEVHRRLLPERALGRSAATARARGAGRLRPGNLRAGPARHDLGRANRRRFAPLVIPTAVPGGSHAKRCVHPDPAGRADRGGGRTEPRAVRGGGGGQELVAGRRPHERGEGLPGQGGRRGGEGGETHLRQVRDGGRRAAALGLRAEGRWGFGGGGGPQDGAGGEVRTHHRGRGSHRGEAAGGGDGEDPAVAPRRDRQCREGPCVVPCGQHPPRDRERRRASGHRAAQGQVHEAHR